MLSRSHPDFIRRLFELEVPEVSERIIEIRALAREAGYRTKIAVSSIDSKVDAVGACVGVRGSRIKNIVVELGGEKIDIVRWNESSQILITNALKPAEVMETALCFELGRATVVVAEDQLSLAIGKRGQNVRLAARLTGWDIDILTPTEYNKGLDNLEKALIQVEGMDNEKLDKLVAMGIISVQDVEEIGIEPLTNEPLSFSPEVAALVVAGAAEAVKVLAAEAVKEKERLAAEKAAAALAGESGEGESAEGKPAEGESEAGSSPEPEIDDVLGVGMLSAESGGGQTAAESPVEPAAEADGPLSESSEPAESNESSEPVPDTKATEDDGPTPA